jgi:hypothetical protein
LDRKHGKERFVARPKDSVFSIPAAFGHEGLAPRAHAMRARLTLPDARAMLRAGMIKAYTAANLQDAHILLGLLHAAGIEARILNSNAQGGLGEIPFMHAYPEIWLVHAHDLERARELFEGFERPPAASRPNRCAACGEENPAGFEICWNCSAPMAA